MLVVRNITPCSLSCITLHFFNVYFRNICITFPYPCYPVPSDYIYIRYGRWTKGKFCPFFETKLIMRTAAIGMFFTHYITLREQPPLGSSFSHYNREPTQLPRKDAAVLHYKDIHNLEASGSIFGATLPIDGQKLKSMECNLVPDMKENTTAARVLDSLTKLALPYLERNYVSQLTEIYAFNV